MPNNPKNKLFLIDGNSFCYRAYYAIRHLSNSKGQPTNAIFGFVSMIKKIIKDEKPSMMAVAFDLKAPTFRHKKYKDYKVHRKPMPEDLVSQLPYIKRLVQTLNIPIYEKEGYEADDVLATIAVEAKSKGVDTFIATGDKDMLQLIGPHIKVYNPQKEGIIYGEKEVKKRYGVKPDKITDLMALMGDTSDNVPGVPGIGEKTAKDLMEQFGSLENVLNSTNKIKSESRRKKIEEGKNLAIISKDLATVRTDVPLELSFEDLELKEPDNDALIALYKELEFKRLLKELEPGKRLGGKYHLVDSKKDFKKLINFLEKTKRFAFDFETTHYDPMRAKAVGVSFSWKEGEGYYVPFNALLDMTEKDVLKGLKPIFENEKIEKMGQNIKYDVLILKNMDVDVKGIWFDTMVASYLLDPSRSRHNLNDIAFEHLGRSKTPIEELLGKGKTVKTMDKVDVRKVCDYCSEDSDLVVALKTVLEKKLAEKDLTDLFFKVEIPLIDVLVEMESNGVSIDTKYLNKLSRDMEKEIKVLEKSIYKLAGDTFNINSSKQLQVILFENLKLPIIKKTKTGASTNEEVLKILSEQHELPGEILRYRKFAKLKSTYVDSLPELVNSRTKRIHTSYNQTVTATGRLSSSAPNLQNIPIKTDAGKKIRKAFIAGKTSRVLLSADYSQIELRILAHLSGDDNLKKTFKDRKDVHAFTASLVNDVKEEDVTPKMRQAAKTVNFGIVYGMSAYGLSKDLGIARHEAAEFIKAYFDRYPKVKDYLDRMIKEARDKGYVTTILGRRRYIPEIKSNDVSVRNFAERTAVNTPIQGSAADLIKLAMIEVNKSIKKLDAEMIMQVHDELVFDVSKEDLHKLAEIVKNGMENVIKLSVPIEAHLEYGTNWLEGHKIKL